MRKTILSLAFALIATMGFEALAQQPQLNPKSDNKEQCQSKPCPKKEWKKSRKQHHHKEVNMLHDIELSDKQKEQINKLDNERREKEQKTRIKARDSREKNQANYEKKLKKILTAEQYNQYLKNKEHRKADGMKVRKKFHNHNNKVGKISQKQKCDSAFDQHRHKKQPMK